MLLALSVGLFVLKESLAPFKMGDLKVYRAEGHALRHGLDLYGPLPGVHGLATYPPFAAMLFVPVSAIGFWLASCLLFVVDLVLVGYVAVASFRLVSWPLERAIPAGFVLSAVGLWFEPVYMTFGYGQVNLALLALVLYDFADAPARFRGVATGLAAAVKVTPLIFIAYLLVTRRFAFTARAIAAFGAAIALSLCVDAHATWAYWTDDLFDSHRMGRPENAVNQTIRGAAVRFEHTRQVSFLVTVVVGLVLVAGLLCARDAHGRAGDALGLGCCAVTGLLCSPISWSHHWVWCIPMVAMAWAYGYRWFAVLQAAVFASFAVWFVPHANSRELHFGLAQFLASNLYVYIGLAYLVAVFLAARSAGAAVTGPNRVPAGRAV
jgi:alpha-1,2-mannosyltransferase